MGTTSSSSTSESYSKGKKVIDSKLKAAARTGVLNMSNMVRLKKQKNFKHLIMLMFVGLKAPLACMELFKC